MKDRFVGSSPRRLPRCGLLYLQFTSFDTAMHKRVSGSRISAGSSIEFAIYYKWTLIWTFCSLGTPVVKRQSTFMLFLEPNSAFRTMASFCQLKSRCCFSHHSGGSFAGGWDIETRPYIPLMAASVLCKVSELNILLPDNRKSFSPATSLGDLHYIPLVKK